VVVPGLTRTKILSHRAEWDTVLSPLLTDPATRCKCEPGNAPSTWDCALHGAHSKKERP
jgi:hypothetical protein